MNATLNKVEPEAQLLLWSPIILRIR